MKKVTKFNVRQKTSLEKNLYLFTSEIYILSFFRFLPGLARKSPYIAFQFFHMGIQGKHSGFLCLYKIIEETVAIMPDLFDLKIIRFIRSLI